MVVLVVTLVLAAIAFGGGIYETLLVDRVWPQNPAIIQPARGGLNRAVFWIIVHPSYEVFLLASLWLNWVHPVVRLWLIAAVFAHFGARVWSFAYFIPRARGFEKMGDLTDDQRRQAERWVHLSRARPLIEIVSIIALGIAIVAEAGNG